MHLNFITANILQKFSKDQYNIVYNQQNNLFDLMLMAIEDHRYYLFNNNKYSYQLPNVIDLPNSYIPLYNYNMHFTNNIIGYTQNNFKNFHLNAIIFTHSPKPAFIKKEDLLLINQKINKEIKIFFSETAMNSWRLENSYLLKYGIPPTYRNINDRTSRKDILIINSENLPHNIQLYNLLRSKRYNCDIITSTINSIEFFNDKFNEYKICIDLSEHNIANLLCSIASGCIGITLKTNMLSSDFNIPGLIMINDIVDIDHALSNNLNIDQSTIQEYAENIVKVYNFDNFSTQMKKFANKSNTEAFVL